MKIILLSGSSVECSKNVSGSILAFLSFPPYFESDNQLTHIASYIENHTAKFSKSYFKPLVDETKLWFPSLQVGGQARVELAMVIINHPHSQWGSPPDPRLPVTDHLPSRDSLGSGIEGHGDSCAELGTSPSPPVCWPSPHSVSSHWNMACPRPSGSWYPIIESHKTRSH